MVTGRRIVKMEERIRFCCRDFQDAYYQYQKIRMKENFPPRLDELEWEEVKPILMLLESFMERRCSWCAVPPHYLTKKERVMIGMGE